MEATTRLADGMTHRTPSTEDILRAFFRKHRERRFTPAQLATHLQLPARRITVALFRMRQRGEVCARCRGLYEVANL